VLYCHARHQEPVERDALTGHDLSAWEQFRRGREPLLELAHHIRRQGEAEAEQGLMQLFAVDKARRVAVEALEDAVPVLFISMWNEGLLAVWWENRYPPECSDTALQIP
jgi:hypothetical protein